MAKSDLQKAYALLSHASYVLSKRPELEFTAPGLVQQASELLGRDIEVAIPAIGEVMKELHQSIRKDKHYRWLIRHGFREFPEMMFVLAGPFPRRDLTREDYRRLNASGWGLTYRPAPIGPVPMDGRT